MQNNTTTHTKKSLTWNGNLYILCSTSIQSKIQYQIKPIRFGKEETKINEARDVLGGDYGYLLK